MPLISRGNRGVLGEEEARVADSTARELFRAKTARLGAPERAGFGLDPPVPVLAQAGEKRAPEDVTGPIF